MTGTPFIAIDFGTSFSKMAWFNPQTGQAEVLRNAEGEEKTPSVVYFGEHETLVGQPAEDLLEDEVERAHIVTSVKRDLVNAPSHDVGHRSITAIEIVATILGKLKRDAEHLHFYQPVTRVVLTHPAAFDALERDLLKEAAQQAGFQQVELVAEPVAAALAYAHAGLQVGQSILVYDLGAGTFDLALLVREGEHGFRLALEPQGIRRLGGDDFDYALYDHCDTLAEQQLGRAIAPDGMLDRGFLAECRKRKENLSEATRSRFSSYLEGGVRFRHEIERATFEELIRERVEQTVRVVRSTLAAAEARGHRIDTAVLIGGSARIPLVRQLVAAALPVELREWQQQDVAVALGAAYWGQQRWLTNAIPSAGATQHLPIEKGLEAGRALADLDAPRYPVTRDEWRAETARRNETFGAPDGYWCYVRPGTYRIGGCEKKQKSANHKLPGFWIARYPITVAQYAAFIDDRGYQNKDYWTPNGWKWRQQENRTQPDLWDHGPFNSRPNQAVIGVTWYECMAFCSWLTARLGAAGYEIRLPTEAEWEAAAAYDEQMQRRTYPWGEEEPTPEHAIFKDDQGNNRGAPAPVGECRAGAAACGALDMGGQVWEYCRSSQGAYPHGANAGQKEFKRNDWDVPLRGGSWWDFRTYVRCAARGRNYPYSIGLNYNGCRVLFSPRVQ